MAIIVKELYFFSLCKLKLKEEVTTEKAQK